MRFSIFLNGRSLAPEDDRAVMIASASFASLAERRGFEAVFLPDHHFTGYAPMASDPFMFAAYLAGTLKKMHFGFSVTSLPLHNPVRFAERINLLDQLTDGRILVGIGSGTTPEEMLGLGINFADSSRVSEENLEIAERLWAKHRDDPAVSFDTGHYKGTVVQRLAPAPFTKPHARLMQVAMKEASARRAAERGWPAFIPAFTPPKIGGTDPFSHVQRYFGTYRTILEQAGHTPEVVADALSWSTHTYQCVHLAETDEQAEREIREILAPYQEAIERELIFNRKADALSGVKIPEAPDALSADWMATWCLFGSPETVIRHLQPYADLGIGNILCGFHTGPLTPQRQAYAKQSLELMASKVLPHFNTVATGAAG